MKYREYHVSPYGDDTGDGGRGTPLRTIRAAANLAQPGDVVTVHEGVYREYIDPPRGGTSAKERIVYQAAPGEHVQIKGSEPAQDWEPVNGCIWKLTLPNTFFGDFNPYRVKIGGHWFIDNGRDHHPGAVYLDGHWLLEAPNLETLENDDATEPRWFGRVDDDVTMLWAEFPGIDPNESDVEIGVRQSVFYPGAPGINYLTVRGFELLHAATPWAPPTTEQIGLIGTNWGKGWIIENNRIAYSACSGMTLGKYDDPEDFGDRDLVEFTTGEDTYHGTIRRALAHGWSLESTGGHLIRGNHVSHCEMAGICGSLGAVKSVVEDNVVHDIHTRRLFNGHEQAGIKFHAPIDTLIRNNRIYRCPKGFWMDWMTQGTRITRNLCYDNGPDADLYVEVNHGPCVIDNNLFLSPWSLSNCSEGTLFAHNLFAGKFSRAPILNRTTPYHEAHSTAVVDFKEIGGGDDRLYHNLFVRSDGLDGYEEDAEYPSQMIGNLLGDSLVNVQTGGNHVEIGEIKPQNTPSVGIIRSEILGTTKTSALPFLDYDGSDLAITTDYRGLKRNTANPTPGPFEEARNGTVRIAYNESASIDV